MDQEIEYYDRSRKEVQLEEDKTNILECVRRLNVSYGSEISRNTLIPKDRAIAVMWALIKEGKLFRLQLNSEFVPIEMLPRMNYFWSTGIHGFEMFSRIVWVIPQAQIPYSKYAYGTDTTLVYDEEMVEDDNSTMSRMPKTDEEKGILQ